VSVSIIEQARIQARVLVPLIQAFQAELGEQRAHAIVRKALAGVYRSLGEAWWRQRGSADLGQSLASTFEQFAADGALDYHVHSQTPDAFEFDVSGCRYAQFYREIGAPELGFLLVCGADFPMAEGFGGEVTLTRTQTLMQGASHCDFRYARRAPDDDAKR